MSAGAARLTKKGQKKNRLNGRITRCIAFLNTVYRAGQPQKFDDQFYTFLIFKRRHIQKNIKTSVYNAFNLLQRDVFIFLCMCLCLMIKKV